MTTLLYARILKHVLVFRQKRFLPIRSKAITYVCLLVMLAQCSYMRRPPVRSMRNSAHAAVSSEGET